MSKLLEMAIARSRALPEAEQDRVAALLLEAIEPQTPCAPLDAETIEALDEALAQSERGEFAADEEVSDCNGKFAWQTTRVNIYSLSFQVTFEYPLEPRSRHSALRSNLDMV